jgi:hypothetical protein
MTWSKIWSSVIYFFVCLNDLGKAPDFFIATPITARVATHQWFPRPSHDESSISHLRGAARPTPVGSKIHAASL